MKTTEAYIYEFAYGHVLGPFYGCDGLNKVVFEDGTTQIANGLFANCSGLKQINISNDITDYYFYKGKVEECVNI